MQHTYIIHTYIHTCIHTYIHNIQANTIWSFTFQSQSSNYFSVLVTNVPNNSFRVNSDRKSPSFTRFKTKAKPLPYTSLSIINQLTLCSWGPWDDDVRSAGQTILRLLRTMNSKQTANGPHPAAAESSPHPHNHLQLGRTSDPFFSVFVYAVYIFHSRKTGGSGMNASGL